MNTLTLLSAWKYLASFLKRDWQLTDYPVHLRRMDTSAGAAFGRDIVTDVWLAQVVNWWSLSGGGQTQVEAMKALEVAFRHRKQSLPKLPRPGTVVPLLYAPTHRIEEHPDLARDFFRRILDMDFDECFISDQSSLYDFHTGADNDHLHEAILLTYGVDVSDVDSGNLAAIFERLVSRGVAG